MGTEQAGVIEAEDHDAGDLDMDLDIAVVERGDAVEALLGDTDNGCDTVKTSDC